MCYNEKAPRAYFFYCPNLKKFGIFLIILMAGIYANAQQTFTTSTCSNTSFSYSLPSASPGDTYTWSLPSISPGGAITNAVSGSGQADVTQTLVNNSISNATATYTVTTSAGTNFILIVTVNPAPVVANVLSSICSGSAFNIVPSGVPAGTSYTWTGPAISPSGVVTGASAQASDQLFIGQTLTNNSAAAATVIYTVKPKSGTCTGNPFLVTVTVNPLPVLGNASIAPVRMCSGTTYSYTPLSSTTGATINWSRPTVSGISNTASQGANNPNEVLNNTTTAAINVNYQFTISANGCSNVQTVPVTVNPLPTLTSVRNPPSVCSGSTFNYTPAAVNTSNPSYTWNRSLVTGISNAVNNGTGAISELLTNTTNATVYVNYSYVITDGSTGCQSTPQLVTVGVTPVPNIADITNISICSGNRFIASPTTPPVSTLYTWTTPQQVSGGAITGGSAVSVGQYFIGQELSNNGTQGVLDYTVTPNTDGCAGTNFHVTVTVTAAGTKAALSNLSPPAICSGTSFIYTPTSTSSVTTYTWKRFYTNGITPSTNSSTGNINEILSNASTVSLVAHYAYTLTAPDGCVNTQEVPVTVYPVTRLSSTLSPLPVCSNSVFSYTPTSSTSGTVFTWTRAVVANISNTAGSGTGNPNEVLINTSTSAVNVSYVFTLTPPNGCVNTQTVIVSVNPGPVLTSTLTPAAICSGTQFSYTPLSATSGITFNWTRDVVTNISNGAGSGINNPAESLVNTGINPVTVPYVYTLSANGCTINQTVNVVVNPTPSVANQTLTSCSNSTLTYTPSNTPLGTQYTWALPVQSPLNTINGTSTGTLQSSFSQTLANNTSNLASATYTLTPIANGCTGSGFTVAVNVNIITSLSSSATPPAICSNTVFSYLPTSNTTGTTYSWSRANLTGIGNASASGTNNPNETLINTTSSTIPVPYTFSLNTPDGCLSSQTVTVSVKPLPVLNSGVPAAICSGTTFSYTPASAVPGAVFNWTRAVIPFVSNGAGAGSGNPAEVLVNTSINVVPVIYNYTSVANGCTNTEAVTIAVNPTPSISSQVASACNNTPFSVNPTNVPANTKYTWALPTASPVGSITGGTQQIIPQNAIKQTLSNITLNAAVATYTVTPSANGCVGTDFTIAVTVNTTTVLSSSLTPADICSNTIFNYTPTSNTIGTSFSWSRAVVNGISNAAASGINDPNEKLINITEQTVPVTYSYALNTPNGCVNTQTITVNVNPAPVLSSTLSPTPICSGATFIYVPASNSIGAAYSWNRSIIPSISNGPGSGSGLVNPSEVLVNTTTNAVSVPYVYSLTANGCSNTQIVRVTVNPTPNVSNQVTSICGNTSFSVTPLNVPTGTQYTWTTPAVSPLGSINGGNAVTVPQTIIGQQLSNQTLNAGLATYTVTPVANGCTGVAFTVGVTVNPTPVVANQTLAPVCSGTAFNFSPATTPLATTYTWGTPITGISKKVTGGTGQPISQSAVSQTLNSTSLFQDTATYTVIPSTAGCEGNSFTLIVPVKPVPVVTNIQDTICTGNAFTIEPLLVPLGTTYTWGTPVSIPFGSTIGGKSQASPVSVMSQSLFVTGSSIAKTIYTVTPSVGGCSGAPFTLEETIGVPLAPITNMAATICSGTAFDLTPTTTPLNTTYTWSTPVSTPVGSVSGFSVKNNRQPLVSQVLTNHISTKGTVIYSVVPFNTGCSGSVFTATVTVSPVPKATISGKAVVCRDPFDTLFVTFAGTAPWSFSYLDNGINHIQTGITQSPYTWVLPSLPVVPTRTLQITLVNDLACVDSTDTTVFVQKVNPLPVGQIISLHGIYLCHQIPDTLFVSYPLSDSLRYQWTRNDILLPGATVDSISTLLNGKYNAILTNQFGCVDTAATPVTLNIVDKPVLKFTYDSYCIGNLILFSNLTDTTVLGPTQWLWNMGDSTTRQTFDATVTYPRAGDRHITLTSMQVYCPANPISTDSTITIEYPIAPVRMPSVSTYKGHLTPIAVRNISGYRYLWTPTRGIDVPNNPSVNFNYQETQDYYVNLISPAGCVTTDSVLVRVFEDKLVDIMVPKSFTPNNDGVNDILYPYLAGIKTFQYFKVYNRFGKLLFETRDPDKGWNGTLNGLPQPMAIYIWESVGIASDGSMFNKKGETLLLR